MPQSQDKGPPITEMEKRRTQQEVGGRTMARPADASGLISGSQPGDASAVTGTAGGIGSLGTRGIGTGEGTSGMSGAPTNDALPGGGTTGDRKQRDRPTRDRD